MARTNLCTNPTAGANATVASTNGFTPSRTESPPAGCPAATAFTCTTDAGNEFFALDFSVTDTLAYTASVYVYRASGGGDAPIQVRMFDSANSGVGSGEVLGSAADNNAWTRIQASNTATETGTWTIRIRQSAAASATDWYVAAVLIEQADEVLPYFDGGLADSVNAAYAWTGTAHASTSTKTDVYGAQRLMTGVM